MFKAFLKFNWLHNLQIIKPHSTNNTQDLNSSIDYQFIKLILLILKPEMKNLEEKSLVKPNSQILPMKNSLPPIWPSKSTQMIWKYQRLNSITLMLHQSIGEQEVQSNMSKTKDNVVHAGLSVQLVSWKDSTRLPLVNYQIFQNNNWLIAQL